MTTSLTEIKQIDELLTGSLPAGDTLVLEARAIIEPNLRENIASQTKLYALVKAYGRLKIRRQLKEMHFKLLRDPSKAEFRKTVNAIFSNDSL